MVVAGTKSTSGGSSETLENDWQVMPTGSPLLPGSVGYVDCTIHAVHEAGDHYVVIGKVLDLVAADARGPLLFFQGKYATTSE